MVFPCCARERRLQPSWAGVFILNYSNVLRSVERTSRFSRIDLSLGLVTGHQRHLTVQIRDNILTFFLLVSFASVEAIFKDSY